MSERFPNAAPVPERKKKIVIAENVGALESAARDAADEKMSELGNGENFIKRIWKQNLAREYYRQKKIQEAKKKIIDEGNLYANLERQPHERSTKEDHDAAMRSVLDRAMNDYVHEMPGSDTYRRLEDDPHSVVTSEEIKNVIRNYIRSDNPDPEAFKDECRHVIAKALFGGDVEKARKAVHHTTNLIEIADQLRLQESHEAALHALDNEYEIVIARVKSGVRTEAKLNRTDRAIAWLQKSRVGSLVNEATLAGSVAVAGILLDKVGFGFVRSRFMAATTLLGSAALGGLYSYRKEQMRLRTERVQHARERAQSKKVEGNSKRRDEMDEFLYKMESATNLVRYLHEAQERDLSEPGNYNAALKALADIESRIQLSDDKKIDLISYSNISTVEQERTQLYVAVAEAKVALRRAAQESAATHTGAFNFDEEIRRLRAVSAHELQEEEGGISQKDLLYKKMESKRARKVAGKGMAWGLVVGTVVQEAMAYEFHTQQGILNGSGRGTFEKLPPGRTLLNYIFYGSQPYGGSTPALLDMTAPDGSKLKLPGGLHLVSDPNNPHRFGIDRADGSPVTRDLMFDDQGRITGPSMDVLKEHGFGVAQELHHTDPVRVNREVPDLHPYSAPEYIVDHFGDKDPKNGFHHIRREFWYDQDSPYRSIGNALRLHWGGASGSGIDRDGNYVFNVLKMTPGGSFHGKHALDVQNQIRNGNLKILLSMTCGTQTYVVEVPIHADGNAVIDDPKLKELFFATDGNGHAVFRGQYAEVGFGGIPDDTGAEHFRILATHGGTGQPEFPQGNRMKMVPQEIPGKDIYTTIVIPPEQEHYWDPMPVVPVPLPRDPLERMKHGPRLKPEDPYSSDREHGGLKDWYTEIKNFRSARSPEVLAALRRHFEEELETNPDPKFKKKYDFLLKELVALEYWDTSVIPDEKRREIETRLQFRHKTGDATENRRREIARIYNMMENVLLEESSVGSKPFPNEFYEQAPLVRGLEHSKEVVVVLDDPIGDAIITTPIVLALDAYFKQNNEDKKITVVTSQPAMLSSLEDQFSPRVRVISRNDLSRAFSTSDAKERFIINAHKHFDDYAALGVPSDDIERWHKHGIDPARVMSIDWSSWQKEEVPQGPGLTRKYDPIPARILREFEIMTGQKLFGDINQMDRYLEKRHDFEQQAEYLRQKYHIAPNEKVVAISAGSSAMPKEYKPSLWAEFLMRVHQEYPDVHVLFIQDPSAAIRDRYSGMADGLINQHQKISKVSEDPRYLNTLMAMANVVVTPDTGLGHLAAAVGTPNVVIGTMGDPIQWSAAKTFHALHPHSNEWRKFNRGVFGDVWKARDQYYLQQDGKQYGASQVPVDRVFEAFKRAMAGETAPPMPDAEPNPEPPPDDPITITLEFKKDAGAGIGNLDTDGFEARISNNSKNQDALAVSADKKVFVVADGLGGHGANLDKEVIARWSRAIAEAVARRNNIASLTKPKELRTLVRQVKEDLEKQGVQLVATNRRIRGMGEGVATTLSVAERIGENTFSVLAIGDSPVYVVDSSTGTIIKQYGEDVLKGFNDDMVENVIGTTWNGKVASLKKPEFIANEKIELRPGQLLVLGSDFFSDYTDAGGNLKQYIGAAPQDFYKMTINSATRAKIDDATLIVIDPYKLPWQEAGTAQQQAA